MFFRTPDCMTVRMPKFIKEPLTQRQIDKWRRDCLSDRIRHASRAVGGVKYLYWTWENTEKTQKEFWEFKYPSRIKPGKRQKMGLGAGWGPPSPPTTVILKIVGGATGRKHGHFANCWRAWESKAPGGPEA